jgi:hypothetical protein
LICAPKSGRLDSIIKVIHGCGPTRFSKGSLAEPLEPGTASVRVISDTGRVPDFLVSLTKALRLTDVELLTSSNLVTQRSATPSLTLLIRTCSHVEGDEAAFSAMVSIRRPELAAAIQASAGRLILRAVSHGGVVGLVRRPLDAANLQALVQAGRSE